jgi:hypothetical protein
MIWLLPPPYPLSCQQLSLILGHSVFHPSSLLTGETGGGGRLGRSQIKRRQESLVLYNPLTTHSTGVSDRTFILDVKNHLYGIHSL